LTVTGAPGDDATRRPELRIAKQYTSIDGGFAMARRLTRRQRIKIRNVLKWPALRLKADTDRCVNCKSCTTNCPMSLDVNGMVQRGDMENSACILCGSCVDICPEGVIHYSFSGGNCSATVIPSDRKEHCDWRESRNLYTEATLAIAGRDSSTRYARSE